MRVPKSPSQWLTRVTCAVVILFLGSGCGPDSFRKHLYQVREDTKRQHKAADIKAAVLPIFSQGLSSTNPLPVQLKSLPIFCDNPTNVVAGYPLGNTNILDFSIGSGFGQWGIVVCRYEQDEQQLTNDIWYKPRLTPWEHGVYFYSDFR